MMSVKYDLPLSEVVASAGLMILDIFAYLLQSILCAPQYSGYTRGTHTSKGNRDLQFSFVLSALGTMLGTT